MIRLTDQEIDAIAQKIATGGEAPVLSKSSYAPPADLSAGLGIFSTIDEAIAAAKAAQIAFVSLPLDTRRKIIADIRSTILENNESLAKAAHSETGLGRWQDKVIKNQVVAEKTPGVEVLYPSATTGDYGLMLEEPAPFGVIGAITPVTNPTSTIICNAIGMLAAGNSVVFNVHPSAKNCCALTISLINKVIVDNGGPDCVVAGVANPTIESAQRLMSHPDIRLIVVTGGPGVVKAAQSAGKRAICAGPGNPPAVVDETADIAKAADDIVVAAAFDNNVICIEEKEVVVVASVADELLQRMDRPDTYILNQQQLTQIEKVIFKEIRGPRQKAKINASFVGKNVGLILEKIGINVPDSVHLAVVEVDENHPLLWTEQMMPVLPVVRVPNADYAIDLGIEIESGCRHTAVMHSKNIDRLSRMARDCNCSIYVKNGRSHAGLAIGGEGYTSFTIASPTGEGMTGPRTFSRWRRCTLVDSFRIT